MVRNSTLGLLAAATLIIGYYRNPWSGIVITPAVILGAWAHELAHYIPLKRWDDGLYIEVWPVMTIRERESSDAFGHVGGGISKDIPLQILRFAMVAPLIIFGWIPIFVGITYGFPPVAEILDSPFYLGGMFFWAASVLVSGADLDLLRNASRIKKAGSLDRVVWENEPEPPNLTE